MFSCEEGTVVGHGHQHGPAHSPAHDPAGPASARHRGRLALVIGLLTGLAAAEVVVGLTTRSLVLLSDAGHVAVDVFGLAMTLAAITAAARPSRQAHRTFGLYRIEVVATLANAVLLAGVAVWVLVEAVTRLREPVAVAPLPLVVTGLGALVVNGIGYALLHRGASEALSLRGASSEVLADGIAALGAVAAGLAIWSTGWRYADPAVAVGIALLIVPRAVALGRAALRVLLEAAPPGLDITGVAAALSDLPGVLEVHDLHVWTVTSGMEAATAHLTVAADAQPGAVLAEARTVLAGQGVDHATLQLEPVNTPGCCHDARW
jgi:cobalt-zinc-cadmium efflux system protein